MRRALRRIEAHGIAIAIGAASLLSSTASASEGGGHNSFLAFFIPESLREWLYSRRNWGELDLIPNTIFVSLVTLVALLWMARRLQRVPETRAQNAVEWLVETLNGMFEPVLGEHGRKYLPFVNSFFLVILAWNLSGFLPAFQAPTAEYNTTLALALVAMIAVQLIAIVELGPIGYLLHLVGKPWWLGILMFPIEVITQVSRVLSLSLRLFANIYAKEMVLIVLFELAVRALYLPIQLPVLFIGLLASLIQAFIFAILVSVYIAQFITHEHEDHGSEAHAEAASTAHAGHGA